MKFNLNQQDLQQALSYCQGVIEKRSTLPILSNILMDAQRYGKKNGKDRRDLLKVIHYGIIALYINELEKSE